jgi:hypothetical protein
MDLIMPQMPRSDLEAKKICGRLYLFHPRVVWQDRHWVAANGQRGNSSYRQKQDASNRTQVCIRDWGKSDWHVFSRSVMGCSMV